VGASRPAMPKLEPRPKKVWGGTGGPRYKPDAGSNVPEVPEVVRDRFWRGRAWRAFRAWARSSFVGCGSRAAKVGGIGGQGEAKVWRWEYRNAVTAPDT
jgi:hypothetical protein